MGNPFQDLKEKRLAQEDEERGKCEAERLAEEREKQLKQEREQFKDQYHAMVMRVLGFLIEALFPGKGILEHELFEDWSIGESLRYDGWGFERRDWSSDVTVRLVFEEGSSQPICFECSGGDGSLTIRCGLTEEELIAALKKLYH